MADVVVDEEFVKEIGEEIEDDVDYIRLALDLYCKSLNRVRENGIMEGQTAEALDAFIEKVGILKKWSAAGDAIEQSCSSYLQNIDSADKYLY